MEPVGQASSARSAGRRSAAATGWALTKDVPGASPKTAGAICRQVSQSMQVESTKKSPGVFSGTRLRGFAKAKPPFVQFYPHNPGAGGPPSQQQERRAKKNPKTTRDDGGAAIPGSQNADLKGRKPKGHVKPPA